MLRLLLHGIGFVAICLIAAVPLAGCGGSNNRASCDGSEECVSVSQVKTGMKRMQSFSFGGSDRDVKFRALYPDLYFELSYSRLPSACADVLPIYENAKLVYAGSWSAQTGCVAFWDTDDPTEKVMAWYEEAFSKSPWSVDQVAPIQEDGSAWLSFNRSGEYAGLLGVGPTGGPYTIGVLYEPGN